MTMLFAVFDTETTGLPLHKDADIHSQPKIIEFGGIITDGEQIIAQEEFICNPGVQIEQVITDITGLTNDDLKGQPPFSHFIPRVREFFAKADASIAHNLSFDKHMILWDMMRIGKGLEDVAWPQIEICTVEQSFHMYGRRMKLTELYNLLVEEYVQKHRALDDVIVLHKVAKAIGVYEAFAEEQMV
jgi:DNA polymerase III alpha subunit (gram-positive type)